MQSEYQAASMTHRREIYGCKGVCVGECVRVKQYRKVDRSMEGRLTAAEQQPAAAMQQPTIMLLVTLHRHSRRQRSRVHGRNQRLCLPPPPRRPVHKGDGGGEWGEEGKRRGGRMRRGGRKREENRDMTRRQCLGRLGRAWNCSSLTLWII